jgi:cystathionine beta-lyase/cystathionine gamma-synthase
VSERRPETAAVRAGAAAGEALGLPVVPPVHRSTIYELESAREFADVMADRRLGYLYSRLRNPSADDLAAAVAELEGAEAALCYASGMAAVNGVLDVFAPDGAPVAASAQLYGNTHSLLAARPDTRFVDVRDLDEMRAAAAGAALVYVETVSNPHGFVADLPDLAAIAHDAGAALAVDNTVATPLACRPLALGADAVLHSATKYLNGHSDVLAGAAAASAPVVERLLARADDAGATIAPDSAWLVRRGIRTLHLRLAWATRSAGRIAEFLESHAAVERVLYPGLASHPSHEVASRLLAGYGALLAFEVRGGRAAGERLMDRVRLCLRATSLGGVETTISHPASTSHRQLAPEALAAAGISAGLLRLSVGCEHPDDLLADLAQALE